MKRLISIILVVCSAVMLYGQSHYESNIAIGGKGGVTLSRVMFSPSVQQNWHVGKMFGATFRYTEERNFGLLVELLFEERGWKENYEKTDFRYQRTFSYIQLPIMTHVYFGSSKFRGFVNLGPELGFMIGESIKSNFDYEHAETVPGFPYQNRHIEQLTEEVKSKFDFGISLGLGLEAIAKRKHSMQLEARLYYGLANVFSSHKSDPFAGSTNLAIQITFGYMFRVK